MNTSNQLMSALKRQIVIEGHADAAQFGVGVAFFQPGTGSCLVCLSNEMHFCYAQDDQEVPVGS